MKKIITLILILTTFMLVTLNTHASGTLITLNADSGNIDTSAVTYDFDGTYLTLNGTYNEGGYSKILEYNSSIINGDYYEIKVTYISGTYDFDGTSGTINFGNNHYFRTNPYPQVGESFTQIIKAGQSGAYSRLVNGNSGTGTFTNYMIKIEFFNIPTVTEFKVNFYHGDTLRTTLDTIYQSTTSPSLTYETLDGYIFRGWYEDTALTTPHIFGTSQSADLNLYAKFVEETNIAQDLIIMPVTNNATAEFHLREENSKAYLVNTATLLSIDYTLLSQTFEGASTITALSDKTFYDTMVIEQDGFVKEVYTLPASPTTQDIKIWFDPADSKIAFDHNGLQHYVPITINFTVYFTNYNIFMQTHNKVTYVYDGGSMNEYINLDEKPFSFTYGNSVKEIRVWYADPQFTTPYDFDQIPTGDITVYGQWLDITTGQPFNPTDPTNPIDPDNPNDPDNPLDPDEPNEDLKGILDFITDYWVALLFLVITIALLSNKKR